MEETKKVYIQRTPKGYQAHYVALSSEGHVIRAYDRLGDISADYKVEKKAGFVELVRQLDRTYNPEDSGNQTI